MPTILIIAGPNGAGKTTFAYAWFKEWGLDWPFLNADEVGREPDLIDLPAGQRDIRAGRRLLGELEDLVGKKRDLALETTLSSGLYARRIPVWRANGYRIKLIYLRLESVDVSLARVAARVANGGHGVPEKDIRRRFGRSLENLEKVYKPLVDEWWIWDSRQGERILAARSDP